MKTSTYYHILEQLFRLLATITAFCCIGFFGGYEHHLITLGQCIIRVVVFAAATAIFHGTANYYYYKFKTAKRKRA